MSPSTATTVAPRERLFVACELTDATRVYLAPFVAEVTERLGAHPVPPSDLHLTLVFLGATPSARIPAICDALADACIRRRSIRAGLVCVSGTPGHRTTRIVAAVFEDPGDAFSRTATAVAQALAPMCKLAPVPMPFWPHVTLARLRTPLPVTPIPAKSEQMFAFDRVTLYASRSAPRGPTQYVPLARIALRVNDSPH